MDHPDLADSDNFTFNKEVTPEESSRYIAHEIVFVLFCLVGLCADTAIIYTTFRFKRMRTVPNIFLANWAIADSCSLLVTPSGYRIISVVEHIPYSENFFCALFEMGLMLHITVMLFVLLVIIDWFIGACFQRASQKFRSFHKYIIGTIWIIALISGSTTTGLCINNVFFYYPEIWLVCTYCAIVLGVIALQSFRAVQKCRKRPLEYPTLMLNLASAFALSYILAYINIIVLNNIGSRHPLLAILSACAIFSSSIVNFTLLYYFNKDFQACFLQGIKCNRGSYDESISDFDIPTDNTGNDNYSVHVSFHNQTEELLTNAY